MRTIFQTCTTHHGATSIWCYAYLNQEIPHYLTRSVTREGIHIRYLLKTNSLLVSLSAMLPSPPHCLSFWKSRHYTITRLEGSKQTGRNHMPGSSKSLHFDESFTTREQVHTVFDLKDALFQSTVKIKFVHLCI